jgi:uncharacterized protein YecE (DUF72 family)
MPFDREQIKLKAAGPARAGVFIGTSSWKYPGWSGMLYDRARYEYRRKFAVSRFERNCLTEYAEVFKTVCVDAAYYTFPSEKYLEGLTSQVPEDFQFGMKVTDEITVKKFPNLARFGHRAGQPNEHFLNANLFTDAFLKPCEPHRQNIGLLMFEFSRFYPSDYEHGREFVEDLDKFLGQLPKGWPYAIEMRNKQWLQPDYFACLASHEVAHVLNSWNAMPSVGEQMAIAGSRPNPNLCAARFLLKPDHSYEQAVKTFEPYDHVKDVYPEARAAGRKLIAEGKQAGGKKKTFIYVNNRLEGNALETIDAMLEEAAS